MMENMDKVQRELSPIEKKKLKIIDESVESLDNELDNLFKCLRPILRKENNIKEIDKDIKENSNLNSESEISIILTDLNKRLKTLIHNTNDIYTRIEL